MICSAWRWGIHLRRMGERTSLALGACTQVGKVFDYKVILVVPAPRVRPSAGPRTGSAQRSAGTQSPGGIPGFPLSRERRPRSWNRVVCMPWPLGERIKVRGRRPRKYVFPARMLLVAAPPHLPVAAQRALLSDSRRASPRPSTIAQEARRLRPALHPIALPR